MPADRSFVESGSVEFPDANYFLATSRLVPGLDGGYTVSVLRRALDFAAVGGVQPTLLTFDFRIDYDDLLAQFVDLGLATSTSVLRNLLTDVRAEPGLLRDRAATNGAREAPADPEAPSGREMQGELHVRADTDPAGVAWRSVVTRVSGGDTTTLYTDFFDSSGHPLFRLPFISGRADWHRADILIDVFDDDGQILGQLKGFGELYRVWIDHVIATSNAAGSNAGASKARPSIVIVEARQVGELLGEHRDRSYQLVHTIHNAHTAAPHLWDSPMDASWAGWFETTANYDAVVWLTEAQKADAERRFGPVSNSVVIPHPAAEPGENAGSRDVDLAVLVTRLVDQKRVDHAIAAWPAVLAARPSARLDIYGDGPLRASLQEQIDALGLRQSVILRGYTPLASDAFEGAAALIVSSNYEGQPLVVLEALSRGCPVVAYDVSYGLSDMIEPGRTGELVPAGDIQALAAAIAEVLGDAERVRRYSANAVEWARAHGVTESMRRSADLFRTLLAPSA